MNFTESLTVRILADSGDLQRELHAVSARLGELEARIARLGNVGTALERSVDRVARLARPLAGISRQLDGIIARIRVLGRIPVRMNVAPALQSLAGLNRLIGQTAARLRMFSAGGPAVSAAPTPGSIRRFARGGVVTGPPGIDRVPALLTPGEFVLREPAARRLGTAFLEGLNQGGGRAGPRREPAPPEQSAAASSTVNHFGGITINVRQDADVESIVRDLRFQGIRLLNRRG